MTSAFTDAISDALDTIRGVAGVEVTYHKRVGTSGGASTTLTATRGTSRYEAEASNGLVTEIEIDDFLFAAADFVFEGIAASPEPERGDEIEVVIGGTTYTYEVAPPSGSEPCFKYSDPDRTQLRVHTKLIRKA